MSRFRWSKLYPKAWQQEFGEEFDAMIEGRGLSASDVADILLHALWRRAAATARVVPLLMAWTAVAFLNIVAKEVQWPAGALLLSSALFASSSRGGWIRTSLLLFLAIPVSSLYFYQIPGIHHEPLYKTAVALIPAFVGAWVGLAIRSIGRLPGSGAKA